MIQALIDWWRGYSEEDMENVGIGSPSPNPVGSMSMGQNGWLLEICVRCAKPTIIEALSASKK